MITAYASLNFLRPYIISTPTIVLTIPLLCLSNAIPPIVTKDLSNKQQLFEPPDSIVLESKTWATGSAPVAEVGLPYNKAIP